MTIEERLDELLSLAALVADELSGSRATQVTFDLSASGDVPYRITVPDEVYPIIGLTTAPELRDRRAADITGVSGSRDGAVD